MVCAAYLLSGSDWSRRRWTGFLRHACEMCGDRATISANGCARSCPNTEVPMNPLNRRDFLKTTIVAGAAASVGTLPLHAARRTATDMVTLGDSGMKVTRLA